MTTISDERLAEIVADKDNFYRDEIKSMARELQSLRAQGGVRVASLEASPAPVGEEILRRIHDALEMSIPHALGIDAESGGYYDTDLSRELRVLADALAAKGGQ